MDAHLPSIVLVDDHVVVRNGLAELIEIMGLYQVSGQYSNGQELIDALTAGGRAPDLILMDLTMPVLDGEQTVKRLKELGFEVPVLILTLNTDEATILRLYRLGIRGYLSKDCTAAGLREAIEDVLKRGYHHSDTLQRALMAGEPDEDSKAPEREAIIKKLTPRELQFLRLVCNEEEYTYEQMAGAMGVSRRTVDGYRESVFDKFGIRSKTGLVLFATRHNLVED
jgi:DNA-binding NarL/FixJ family response regulator